MFRIENKRFKSRRQLARVSVQSALSPMVRHALRERLSAYKSLRPAAHVKSASSLVFKPISNRRCRRSRFHLIGRIETHVAQLSD
jgi:hypothetical protein